MSKIKIKKEDAINVSVDGTKLVRDQAIADLTGGKESRFWLVVKSIIQSNVDFMAKQVLEDEELTDEQRNDIRKWRRYLQNILELPERNIASLGKGATRPTDLDPFYKTYEELAGRKGEKLNP